MFASVTHTQIKWNSCSSTVGSTASRPHQINKWAHPLAAAPDLPSSEKRSWFNFSSRDCTLVTFSPFKRKIDADSLAFTCSVFFPLCFNWPPTILQSVPFLMGKTTNMAFLDGSLVWRCPYRGRRIGYPDTPTEQLVWSLHGGEGDTDSAPLKYSHKMQI